MDLDSLWPWRGALLALAAALLWAGAGRALRRPDLAALGAGVGLAAGWVLTLGLITASPRQLPERLPLLALATAGAGLLLALAAGGGRGRVAGAGAVLALLAAAWWLAGAPLAGPDLRRAAVVLLGLGVLALAAQARLRGAPEAAAAFGLLLAGLWLARPLGPWTALAAAALAAALGALPAGTGWGAAARLPVAAALAALAAGPVLARGAAVDWLAAAAALAALWLGPALAPPLRGRLAEPLGWLVAGGLPLLFIWLLVRGL
jgi:hypothetical protein